MGWAGNLHFGALHWRRKVARVFSLQKRIAPDKWLEVRYEDLLADVAVKLGEICAFHGVPYSGQMLHYHENSTYAPVDPTNAERWRQILSPREIYLAEMAAGELLERSGYKRIFPAAQLGPAEHFAILCHHRFARLHFNCKRYGTYLFLMHKLCRAFGIRNNSLECRFQAISEKHIK